MLEPWEFVLVALASYRITRFFVFDSLMGFNLESRSKMSQRLDIWAYTADGEDKSFVRGKVGDLLTCTFCLGFWITAGTWAAWYFGSTIAHAVVTVFAVAGVQCMLNVKERNGHSWLLGRLRARRKARKDKKAAAKRVAVRQSGRRP